MNCTESRIFIDAFIDGELDLARSIELERHLETCAACAALCASRKGVHQSLADPSLRHSAPAALRKRVRGAIAAQDRSAYESATERTAGPRWRWAASAIAVALGVAAFSLILRLQSPEDPIEREIVDAHVRSLQPNHLTDVISTDQHTVKPWFAGKVDISPPVKDLASQGFPLIGGRIDYIDRHPAAVLVYQRNKHVINVFVWNAPGADSRPSVNADQGYNVIEIGHAGLEFWIVSDLNAVELRQFTDLLQN